MRASTDRRRWAGGLVAVALAAAGVVVGVATPAEATGPRFTRYELSTPSNLTSPKSVTVSCPEGELVHSTGGRILGGAGGVALTGIVPDAGLTSVTAEGEARPGFTGAWSVTAYAVCFNPALDFTDVVLVDSGPTIGNTATATCTGNRILLGVGFDLLTSLSFVDRVVPSADLSRVDVRALGAGIAVAVKAYGICGVPHAAVVLTDESPINDASPKVATTDPVPELIETFGKPTVGLAIGAEVGSTPGNVLLDALFPHDDLRTVRAKAAVVTPLFPLPGGASSLGQGARSGLTAAGTETDDDWSTIVYAEAADWY